MVNGNLVLTILCVTELQLILLICSFIFNSQNLNILSTSQCIFWTWTKTCERKINFSLLAWQMFSCSVLALLLLHWRLFWFHFLLKLLLFMGKRNVVSLLCLYLLKKDQISDPSTNLFQSSVTHQSIHESLLNPINESPIEVWITTWHVIFFFLCSVQPLQDMQYSFISNTSHEKTWTIDLCSLVWNGNAKWKR